MLGRHPPIILGNHRHTSGLYAHTVGSTLVVVKRRILKPPKPSFILQYCSTAVVRFHSSDVPPRSKRRTISKARLNQRSIAPPFSQYFPDRHIRSNCTLFDNGAYRPFIRHRARYSPPALLFNIQRGMGSRGTEWCNLSLLHCINCCYKRMLPSYLVISDGGAIVLRISQCTPDEVLRSTCCPACLVYLHYGAGVSHATKKHAWIGCMNTNSSVHPQVQRMDKPHLWLHTSLIHQWTKGFRYTSKHPRCSGLTQHGHQTSSIYYSDVAEASHVHTTSTHIAGNFCDHQYSVHSLIYSPFTSD
jgi:hypothetical protein